jgi:hypothetical protein
MTGVGHQVRVHTGTLIAHALGSGSFFPTHGWQTSRGTECTALIVTKKWSYTDGSPARHTGLACAFILGQLMSLSRFRLDKASYQVLKQAIAKVLDLQNASRCDKLCSDGHA